MNPLILALAMTGCGWNSLPDQSYWELEGPLWDDAVVAAADGLYMRLPHAGKLIRLTPPEGEDDPGWNEVGAWPAGTFPERLMLSPDGATVLAFGSYATCELDDETIADEKIESVEDCLVEDENAVVWHDELNLVRDGELLGQIGLNLPFNTVAFNDEGTYAVAYLDFDLVDTLDGALVNPNEVLFIDLATGTATSVAAGFSPERVLFTQQQDVAVVMSRNQVVVVELTSGTFDTVTAPTTTNLDDSVVTRDAGISPDGRYMMMTVESSTDLYILDISEPMSPNWSLVSMDAVPADMQMVEGLVTDDEDDPADLTVVTYSNRAQVDLLEQKYLTGIETLELEEPATNILAAQDQLLLFNTSGNDYHDVYLLDPNALTVEEMRAENRVMSMQLSPDRLHAVAVLSPEGSDAGATAQEQYYDESYGLGIFDLGDASAFSLVAASQPIGVAFSGDENLSEYALALLQGQQELIQVRLTDGGASSIPLEAPATAIGSFGDGQFYITHESDLGLVSFLDPETGSLETVHGFATSGLIDDETTLGR